MHGTMFIEQDAQHEKPGTLGEIVDFLLMVKTQYLSNCLWIRLFYCEYKIIYSTGRNIKSYHPTKKTAEKIEKHPSCQFWIQGTLTTFCRSAPESYLDFVKTFSIYKQSRYVIYGTRSEEHLMVGTFKL